MSPEVSERESAPRLVAMTGATGFIGRHLVVALAAAGWQVRLLLRREPAIPEWRSLRPQVVAGDLDDADALARLVDGAGAVIHLAGLIKAARRRQYFAVNHEGTARLAQVTRRTVPDAHVVHVSSMAAREPGLSDYAASKRAGEDAVLEILDTRASVLRPPVVYGPGDRATLVFFQLARRRLVPLLGPPDARAALIHVGDLVELLVRLLAQPPGGAVVTAADARPQGYRWGEVLGAAARAVGNPAPRFVQVPGALLRGVAAIGDVARAFGSATMVSSQKLRELRHEDWSVAPEELARVPGWTPRFDLSSGFADAEAWYRAAGWLPRESRSL